jgi:hypothetical protein
LLALILPLLLLPSTTHTASQHAVHWIKGVHEPE